jgi:4-alpha-glucanotransferase
MKYKRNSGILLHPTSFPGPDGIGDLGPEAYRWIDFLDRSGCALWQILPLGPTGYGDSPYQCFSAFAGNPYLVSPALLLEDQLLTRNDLLDRPVFPQHQVDYGRVIQWKLAILDRAFARFKIAPPNKLKSDYDEFVESHQTWLNDVALFLAIKEVQGGGPWVDWPDPLRKRSRAALDKFKKEYADIIEKHTFRQFLFFRQWLALLDYAHSKGIQVIGDIPIFVAFDSADAWANPELFYMDEDLKPTAVAGVPPDYFSPTGQLWGNPLYKWENHQKTQYAWWIERFKACLELVDIVRLDHFRGFAGYWEIPAGMPTAEVGKWVPGPGTDFLHAIKEALGDLPIIAEDLGEITPDVVELREQFDLPGMKILQFGFAAETDDPFLPHNYPHNCVAYTGTHDNDTVRGWYNAADEKEKDLYRRYFARSGEDVSWDLIRGVWSSVAVMTLAPLQDFLSLDTSARMNYPGRPAGNWTWRYHPDSLSDWLVSRIHESNVLYSRLKE